VGDVNVVSQPNFTIGQGDLVTSNGTTWTHYEDIPVNSIPDVRDIVPDNLGLLDCGDRTQRRA
jgi:hypothetical protein